MQPLTLPIGHAKKKIISYVTIMPQSNGDTFIYNNLNLKTISEQKAFFDGLSCRQAVLK